MVRKAPQVRSADAGNQQTDDFPLAVDLEYFQAQLARWLEVHRGKYALVRDAKLVGVYDNPDNAYAAGVDAFGNVPFLIRQVTDEVEPATFPALTAGVMHADP